MRDPLLTNRLTRSFDDYATYHRSKKNRITHAVGIPFIVFSLLGLASRMGSIPIGPWFPSWLQLDAGTLIWLLAGIYTVFLDWRLAIPFQLAVLSLYVLATRVPTSGLIAIFIAGWALQGLGHAIYEKNRPAFLTHARHFLIGPLWVFAHWVNYI